MEFSSLSFSCSCASIDELLPTLSELNEAECHPFPSQDIKHIAKTVTSRKIVTRRAIAKGFSPDWNTFAMTTSGSCSWGRNALDWPTEHRARIAGYLSKSFFERYPEYLPVRRWITETNTPELFRDFVLHEEMRVNVLALIRLLDQLEGQPT